MWIKFNKWFYIFTDTDMKKCHKIVIIGDGFAEGFGDYIIMGSQPGLSHYLPSEIKSDLNVSSIFNILFRYAKNGNVIVQVILEAV